MNVTLSTPTRQFMFYERAAGITVPLDFTKCQRCGGTGYWRWECRNDCGAAWPHLHYESCVDCDAQMGPTR